MYFRLSQARDGWTRCHAERHDRFVDYHRSNRKLLRASVADVKMDLVAFENIFFHVKVFDWYGRFQTESAASIEEECNHTNQKNDWDEEQDQSPKGEAVW